jgi:O-antigen ligase
VEARRPQALEAGLFLFVVALPLAFFPLSAAVFSDVKLLVLALATLLLWISGLPLGGRLAAPALALAGAIVLSAALGVDPATSLVGEIRPTGVATLLCSIALVALGPSIPDGLLGRARGWLVWSAVLASAVALTEHLAPNVLDLAAARVSFVGATFGNPVLLAGFLAAAIPAALGRPEEDPWRTVAVFAALGSGFAVVGERSAFLLPPLAFLAAWWFVRPVRRRLLLATGAMTAAVLLWTLLPIASAGGHPDPGRVAGQFGTLTAERQRFAMWQAQARALVERPLIGWGPGNEWSAFISSGTAGQISEAGRYWGDAHNLPLEVGVISGLAGLAGFAWLLIRLAPRAARPSRPRAWATASAAALAVYSLYEPMDVTLTPLMFLLAGVAAGVASEEPSPAADEATPRMRPGRIGVAAVLVALTAVAGIGLAASALEQWGRTHFGARWALESAWSLAPWRISAGEGLAIDLALDGRAGDQGAAAQARGVVDRLVKAHPSNPGIRLLAADVELLLRNFPETQAWIRRQLEAFPNDDVEVPTEEPGFTPPT